MSTKIRIERHTETWRVKLGIGGVDGIDNTPIEGVRIGYGMHEGMYYKPVEMPRHVWEFLGGRIVPADYMWPYYVHEGFRSLEDVAEAAGPGAAFTIVDADESIIEFTLEVEE